MSFILLKNVCINLTSETTFFLAKRAGTVPSWEGGHERREERLSNRRGKPRSKGGTRERSRELSAERAGLRKTANVFTHVGRRAHCQSAYPAQVDAVEIGPLRDPILRSLRDRPQLYLAAVTHRVSTALVCFVLAGFLLGGRCSLAGDQGLLARFASTLRGLHPRVLLSPMGLVPVLDGQ